MVGESDVPLTEDVVKKPPREFSATFSEWAADNVEQIVKSKGSAGDLNVVPENHTLFITSAFITASEEANATTHGNAQLRIRGVASTKATLLVIEIDHITGQHGGSQALSITFPMPIKIESGLQVNLTESGITTPGLFAGFTGFLLPKKISIR